MFTYRSTSKRWDYKSLTYLATTVELLYDLINWRIGKQCLQCLSLKFFIKFKDSIEFLVIKELLQRSQYSIGKAVKAFRNG